MRRVVLAFVCFFAVVALADDDATVSELKSKIRLADMKQTIRGGFLVTNPGTPLVVQKEGLSVGWAGDFRRTTKIENGQVVSQTGGRPLGIGENVFLYKVDSTPTSLILNVITVDNYDSVKPGHGDQRIEFAYENPLRQVGAEKVLSDVRQWLKTETEDRAANNGRPSRANEPLPATADAPLHCKPDLSSQDKITKKTVEEWQQVLSASGILSAALLDNDVTVTAAIRRAGDKSSITLSIQKVEENLARAAFESHYRAAKGDQLAFGFTSGEPATLVVTQAFNEAKAGGLFGDKLNLTAAWSAELGDAELSRLRSMFTTHKVDAFRISSANGQIDQSVPDRVGQRLMEKFVCFYALLDQRGIDLSAASAGATSTAQGARGLDGATKDTISLEQIIEMSTAKLPDDVIVATINKSRATFEVTPQVLIKLKNAGVSDTVIRALAP